MNPHAMPRILNSIGSRIFSGRRLPEAFSFPFFWLARQWLHAHASFYGGGEMISRNCIHWEMASRFPHILHVESDSGYTLMRQYGRSSVNLRVFFT